MRLLILILLTGCVSQRSFDRDIKDPAYHSGDVAAVGSIGTASVDGATAGARGAADPQFAYRGSGVESMVLSAISVVANPHYYRATTISGTCVIGEVQLTQIPCRSMPVELRSSEGKTLGRATTDAAGEFAFYVRKGEIYRLNIADSRFTLSEGALVQQAACRARDRAVADRRRRVTNGARPRAKVI